MPDTLRVLNQVLPILLLIMLGGVIRSIGLLSGDTVEDLKKLVIHIALPSVLFLSFMDIRIETSHLVLAGFMFGLCVLLLLLGRGLARMPGLGERHTPFLFTGFEYGMIGIGLFGSGYGLENVKYIAVADLGHEFFIWFVFAPLLVATRDGRQRLGATLVSFLTSPIIIAILSGLVLGYFGLKQPLEEAPVAGAFMRALEFLGALTIPLILLVVGFGMRISFQGLGKVLAVVGLRFAIMIPLALAVNWWLLKGVLGMAPPFSVALLTLMLLPPPFIIPLFIPPSDHGDIRFVNNVLTVHTLASILAFTALLAVYPDLS